MLPPYLSFQKTEDYFELLKLARHSGWNKTNLPSEEKSRLTQILNTLSTYKNSIRPLVPLLNQNTRRLNLFNDLTEESKDILKKGSTRIAASEMLTKQWLSKILDCLNQNNISVILLKSEAFSGSLYSADAPRPGSDIDILVTEENFEKACRLLSKYMAPLLIDQARIATHNTLFERIFRPKQGTGPTIEIHKGLTNPLIFNINETALWQQSVKHPSYDNERVRILSPEHTLLHLAVHAFRDLDFCSHNLIDAHEVVSQWQPEENTLIYQAKKWGAKHVLYCLLKNCQAVLDTPIPNRLLSELHPCKRIDKLNKKILLSITKQDSIEKNKRFRLQQLLCQFSFPDKISNSLRFQLNYSKTRIKDLFT